MKFFTVRAKFSLSLALGASLLSLVILVCSVGFSPEDPRLTATQPPIKFDEEGEGPRSDWFYAQRAYPLNVIPRAARMRTIEQLELEKARLKARHAALHGETDPFQSPAWVPLGPAPIGQGQTFGSPRVAVPGRVSTVVFDPGDNGSSNQTAYLGAAQDDLWRSRENGATWTPLTDDKPALASRGRGRSWRADCPTPTSTASSWPLGRRSRPRQVRRSTPRSAAPATLDSSASSNQWTAARPGRKRPRPRQPPAELSTHSRPRLIRWTRTPSAATGC